jgi:hypothetical protein
MLKLGAEWIIEEEGKSAAEQIVRKLRRPLCVFRNAAITCRYVRLASIPLARGGGSGAVIKLGELVTILDLHRQSVSAIARQLGIDRKTVRRYLERGLELPSHLRPKASSAQEDRSLPAIFTRAACRVSGSHRRAAVARAAGTGVRGRIYGGEAHGARDQAGSGQNLRDTV